MSEIVVIGGGIGGLSAALSLGGRGRPVVVLEAAEFLGGKAGVVEREGLTFDTGPSVLTMSYVFEELFSRAGLAFEDFVKLRTPNPSFRYLYPGGGVLDVFVELEETRASVERTFGARARDEFTEYLDLAGKVWRAAEPHFVRAPAPDFARLLRSGPRTWAQLVHIDGLRTMGKAIRSVVKTPELVMLFERYATYNGSDVRRAPGTLGCIAHVELALGGYGVEGGIGALVAGLVAAGEKLGVRYRTNTRVRRVELARGSVASVVTDEGRIPTTQVVANVEARHLFEELVPEAKGDREPPTSMSAYNAVYSVPSAGRVAHTVVFPTDYEAEFRAIFDEKRVPSEPTIYLCAQEECHGRTPLYGRAPLFAMVNAPPDRGGAVPSARDVFVPVEKRLASLGLLDDSARLLWERTPHELAERFPGSDGALYGPASNDKWTAFRRTGNRIGAPHGLYFAHGSGHPGGGLPLVAQAGMLAADALLEDER